MQVTCIEIMCAGGGIVLRCDVFVDTIQRIEITTRTRELLLEEEPERFELQAFDDEGKKLPPPPPKLQTVGSPYVRELYLHFFR